MLLVCTSIKGNTNSPRPHESKLHGTKLLVCTSIKGNTNAPCSHEPKLHGTTLLVRTSIKGNTNAPCLHELKLQHGTKCSFPSKGGHPNPSGSDQAQAYVQIPTLLPSCNPNPILQALSVFLETQNGFWWRWR
ncbi:hypothetical protein ACFX1R_031990 [Malus domestica]